MISVVLYWLAIRAYTLGVRVAAMFNPKAKKFIEGRKDLLQNIRYSLIDEKRPRIWMHCASLGEFEQGRPVLEKLRQQYSSHAIVLTFFSPSGYEVRKNYEGADYVFYLPTDSASNAKNFLSTVKPSLAIFVKYDLWYFMLSRLGKLQVPTILISAIFRKSQPFFSWYGKLHRNMLQVFDRIFVQDNHSLQMLERIGIEHITVAGDTRFDRVAEVALKPSPIERVDTFKDNHKLIVAGSTWKDDELLLKQVTDKLGADWKTVIVPHETNSEHITALDELYGGEAVLWSRFDKDYYDQKILIVDTVGLLLSLYQYADVTYIGGGFNKSGIHNILEAAVYGKPVFHGPIYHKFREARELLETGASLAVSSGAEMLAQLNEWETNRISYNAACVNAKQYVNNNTGATKTIINYVAGKDWLSKS